MEEEKLNPTIELLKFASKKYKMLIIGGSIPTSIPNESKKVHNTTLIFKNGKLIGKYHKLHLFDVNIPEKNLHFQESDFILPGNDVLVLDTEYGKFGFGICYDI